MKTSSNLLPIVFFDGFCILCNGWVDFLLRADKKRILHFAPLQGQIAKERVKSEDIDAMNSIVYVDENGVYNRSTAIIRMLVRLGGVYRIAAIFRVIPTFIRNALYDWIAAHRYRWFGKRSTCRLPTSEEKGRILD